MEHIPIEVIGYILSWLDAARDVVVASTTCRKWQKARRNYLHFLSFNLNDCPEDFTSNEFEILVTRTISQTKGLRCLSIVSDDELGAPSVLAWLIYTRETLRRLYFDGWTTPGINILEECSSGRLEILSLAYIEITAVDPVYHKFPFLNSLSLSFLSISALDLSLLLSACPIIEKLALIELDIVRPDARSTIHLNNSHLKDTYVEGVRLDKFIIEADTLEKLHLKDCPLTPFDTFKLVGKGTLKHLVIYNVSVDDLDDVCGESEKLEVVSFSFFYLLWQDFHQMIKRSSKLRRLKLCVDFGDLVVDYATISSCCPLLSHLSLWDNNLNRLNGSFLFKNMIKMDLKLNNTIDEFSHLVKGFIERCPNLKKMVIKTDDKEFPEELTSLIDDLARKFMHVETEIQISDFIIHY